MKRIAIALGLMLLWTCFSAAQQHSAVEKSAPVTSAQELRKALNKNAKILVIDVRGPQEFATGHIAGAVNIPIDDLAEKLTAMKVAKDTTVVTMCEHGGRSSRAVLELQKMGYKTVSYCTLDSWKKCGYKVEAGNAKPPA